MAVRDDDVTQARDAAAAASTSGVDTVARIALRELVLAMPKSVEPTPIHHRFLPGETVGILGGNASGKTLLLRTILGLVKPRSGRVRVETADMYEDSPRAVQAALFRIGFVMPASGLMGATNVYDNVALQLRYFGHHDEATIEDRVLDWLDRLDVIDVARSRPAALTVHQQRRVELARALVHDPTVLLLDEPFGQLDAASSARMLDVLTEWKAKGDRTTLIATVGSSRVRHLVDRMLYIERGELRTSRPDRDPLLNTQQAKALESRVAIEQSDSSASATSPINDLFGLDESDATEEAGPSASDDALAAHTGSEDTGRRSRQPTIASMQAAMRSGDGELAWGDLARELGTPDATAGEIRDALAKLEADEGGAASASEVELENPLDDLGDDDSDGQPQRQPDQRS